MESLSADFVQFWCTIAKFLILEGGLITNLKRSLRYAKGLLIEVFYGFSFYYRGKRKGCFTFELVIFVNGAVCFR